MTNCDHLVADNIGYLQQAARLLQSLTDDSYGRSDDATYGSALGGHVRHCLDHYANFLAGLAAGRIDYDARERDPRIEKDRAAALARIEEILRALPSVREDRPVQVKMDCGDDTDPSSWWSDSTIRRELQFLISHTVHHYALIRLILKFQGLDTGPDFGVAPSTLRYQTARSVCAR